MKLERKPDKLGDILVAHEMTSQDAIDAALGEQKKTKERMGQILARRGAASAEDVNWALANQYNISYMPVSQDQVDPEIVRIVPEDMARRSHILPLLKVANDLIAVVDDPLQESVFEDIERLTGLDLSICLGKTSEIQSALETVYGARAEGVEEESSILPLSERFARKELAELADDLTGAKLLDRLLIEAAASGAETVHLDQIGPSAIVRARIAGRLEAWWKLAGDLKGVLSTRVRVLAGIGATEDAVATGELHREVDGKHYNLLVSLFTAANGESLLLKPQREAVDIPSLKDLGFTKAQLKQVRSLAELRRGLIVSTGPRASGKTTTLYSIFNESDPLVEKLVAIENESSGAGDRALSLLVTTGDDLDAIMKTALAADPDAVLIQPMPTPAVLERAIHEALQGIKVGIQLPLGDSAEALSFLLSGAIAAQVVAGSIAGVIAQRIVRTLCEKCKKPDKAPASLKIKDAKPHRAEGCPACNGTGYAGRTAIFEVVIPDTDLRALIASRPDIAAIRSALSHIETVTLRERALMLYSDGLTSAAEIAEFI